VGLSLGCQQWGLELVGSYEVLYEFNIVVEGDNGDFYALFSEFVSCEVVPKRLQPFVEGIKGCALH